jgi:acetylornithine/succinyldiaminopimelate/putrescine aminotransferase
VFNQIDDSRAIEMCIVWFIASLISSLSHTSPSPLQYYSRYPLTIKNGKGCMLYTTDGKEYLDCVAGIAACVLGRINEYLTKAVTAQMEQVHHVSNLYFIPTQAALANWLCENSVADKVFSATRVRKPTKPPLNVRANTLTTSSYQC